MRTPAVALLALTLAACLAACEPGAPSDRDDAPRWIDVTIGGIPPRDRALLVLPPAGFLVDVRFPPRAETVPDTLSLRLRPWSGAGDRVLDTPLVRRDDGATFRIPETPKLLETPQTPETPETGETPRPLRLEPGSYTIWATVDWADGTTESVSLAVAVREPSRPAPLAGGQWIQLDFEADRDGDAMADLPADLASFGLASGHSPSVDMRIESWVISEIVRRTAAFYDVNPSDLPEGDPLPIVFSADAPDYGPYTRICVAGASPTGGSIIGNVLLDPGNQDRSDEACDDFLPSGVFPRELHYYAGEPSFQAAFGPLLETPAGHHPLDPVVLSPDYDPALPEQRTRRAALARGVETLAQLVASVTAHEAGHAMGLVPPGAPGAGLYGGEQGSNFTHNLTPDGEVPDEKLLMNPGPTLSFDDLAGTGGTPLPRLRALNFAYLQGRLVLDARIDGIHPPPVLDAVSPSQVSTDGGLLVGIEVRGRGLLPDPSLLLRGPTDYWIEPLSTILGLPDAPDRVVGSLLAPTLLPGFYDVELTNRDGQRATLSRALEVR